MVGLIGLEPMTPALSRRCSNQLSYRPKWIVDCRLKDCRLKIFQSKISIQSIVNSEWWRLTDSNR